ncbi:MAG TPA: FKBP-type peptidyl-prolyl cis-trans isomerase [Candidatus Limnocylindria bacterium]|nr:FKBP-type peptidyl-prolyl cis-trans isomerase [Candidatus Limnocylindria bacterium]
MKHHSILFALASLLAVATQAEDAKPAAVTATPALATTTPAPGGNNFTDAKERTSYAMGVMIANQIKKNLHSGQFDVNPDTLLKAFTDAFTDKPTLLSEAEAQGIFKAYSAELQAKLMEKRKADAEKNKKAGEEFLAANKTKEGVVTLPSGLQYKIIKEGTGPKPAATNVVVTHYKGTLIDGTEFDSSYSRGEPATFAVNRVIKGWTEALELMPVGSKWQLFIPSELAYGPGGQSKIGPNSTLIFDIELLSIKEPAAAVAKPAPPVVTSDIIKVPSKAEMEKGAKIEVLKPADVEKLQKEEAAKKAAAEKK